MLQNERLHAYIAMIGFDTAEDVPPKFVATALLLSLQLQSLESLCKLIGERGADAHAGLHGLCQGSQRSLTRVREPEFWSQAVIHRACFFLFESFLLLLPNSMQIHSFPLFGSCRLI